MKTKMPKIGQEILFTAFDNLYPQPLEKRGIVLDDAAAYVKAHPELESEYGGVLPGAAFIVKETPPSEALHLVTLLDLIAVY